LKEEYGGGMKEFNFEDHDCFLGTDDSEEFFNSQERQCIIHYMLNNLRATKGEILGTIRFLEGQAISMFDIYL
jgi:anoctamin-8